MLFNLICCVFLFLDPFDFLNFFLDFDQLMLNDATDLSLDSIVELDALYYKLYAVKIWVMTWERVVWKFDFHNFENFVKMCRNTYFSMRVRMVTGSIMKWR